MKKFFLSLIVLLFTTLTHSAVMAAATRLNIGKQESCGMACVNRCRDGGD